MKIEIQGDRVLTERTFENPVKDGETEVGTQKQVVTQDLSLDGVKKIKQALLDEKDKIEANISDSEERIKKLPRFSDRELANLKKFKENFEKVQQLQQKEQLEQVISSNKEGLSKLNKDLEELNAIEL